MVNSLLLASIPNPLFDLAGITCGHFLVPFWTFFGATLIGAGPRGGLGFGVFETLKDVTERHEMLQHVPPSSRKLLFGYVAGLCAETAIYPLDTVRRCARHASRPPPPACARPRRTLSAAPPPPSTPSTRTHTHTHTHARAATH